MTWRIAPVRQQVSTERVNDVTATTRGELRALPLNERVRPGMRVAVGVPSRGIPCLPELVRVVIDELRLLNAQPFLIPAMGSHGGGTAEGQRAVLESYGLGENATGVPIISSLETVQIGETDNGMPIFIDRHAAAADGIIVINRIKEHTSFKARWESGLLKILSVGLGKERGAAEIHNWGVADAMPAAARVVLARMPVLAAIGIVENGCREPARIEVLSPERIEIEEPILLDLARRLLPKIPSELEPIDLLIVQEMGKDISGTGMDLNVIGMWRRTGGPISPRINVVAVLDMTPNSHGNAIGIGHADLIPQRIRSKIDLAATYTNCLTAHNLAGGKIPITLPTDRDVIEAGLTGITPQRARIVLVRNTLALDLLWVSEPLLSSIDATPTLKQIGSARPLGFDTNGNLIAPAI